jgi:hypothetical protein
MKVYQPRMCSLCARGFHLPPDASAVLSAVAGCCPHCVRAAAPRDVFAPGQPQGQYKFKALVMQLQVTTTVCDTHCLVPNAVGQPR